MLVRHDYTALLQSKEQFLSLKNLCLHYICEIQTKADSAPFLFLLDMPPPQKHVKTSQDYSKNKKNFVSFSIFRLSEILTWSHVAEG